MNKDKIVKCIETTFSKDLIKGNKYDVGREDLYRYFINKDEKGHADWYSKKHFK